VYGADNRLAWSQSREGFVNKAAADVTFSGVVCQMWKQ
jgi:hypothetical protein